MSLQRQHKNPPNLFARKALLRHVRSLKTNPVLRLAGHTAVGGGNDEEAGDGADREELPYPGFTAKALFCLSQTTRPRSWCLVLVTWKWFERISMTIILLNCLTLGMYEPCIDSSECTSTRCRVLQNSDYFIFAFFTFEMAVKVIAMGFVGRDTYLAEAWNILDFIIVVVGAFEYAVDAGNPSISAIRTFRVLRPLRAINRIPSMRILVMLLLDTMPMLGNVLLLCFFVFFIFGIVGVQLWTGLLRNRCFLAFPANVSTGGLDLQDVYAGPNDEDFICSKSEDDGMTRCSEIPNYIYDGRTCNGSAVSGTNTTLLPDGSCINWNQYYTDCKTGLSNPFKGSISFDNIGLAWVAIFQVISLEGWVDIMYYIQDAHSFWDWMYFVALIVIGAFFMINLCLVVIATQFAETKKRETEKMIEERLYQRSSNSSSSLDASEGEPIGCYLQLIRCIAHLIRKTHRKSRNFLRISIIQPFRERFNFCSKSISDEKGTRCGCCHERTSKRSKSQGRCQSNTSSGTDMKEYRLRRVRRCSNEEVRWKSQNFAFSSISPPSISRETSPVKSKSSGNIILYAGRTSPKDKEVQQRVAPRASPEVSLMGSPPSKTRPICKQLATSNSSSSSVDSCYSEEDSQSRRRTSFIQRHQTLQTQQQQCHITPRQLRRNSQVLLTPSSAFLIVPARNIVGPHLGSARLSLSQSRLPNRTNYRDSFSPQPRLYQQNPHLQQPTQHARQMLQRRPAEAPRDPVESTHLVQKASSPTLRGLERSSKDSGEESDTSSDSYKSSKWIQMFKRKHCKALDCFLWLRKKLQRVVDSTYFQRGILLAILINSISMGVEYHNQPKAFTTILENCNIFFATLFGVEMVLKLVAHGVCDYVQDGFNAFDGFIVIVSVTELFYRTETAGLSVLRTFRLLRILKLVRFLPALRYQLLIMLKTMDNVATFFALLCLFIFIFSILGMNLFGCKFCDENSVYISKHSCGRKNFDSLLWAIITVFQILTQEDWNEVLYTGMSMTSAWAALYFIALMTFGNYVLFNLLVAILVEGFSAEGEERMREDAMIKAALNDMKRKKSIALDIKCSKPPDECNKSARQSKIFSPLVVGTVRNLPVITRTVATPVATPQTSPGENALTPKTVRDSISISRLPQGLVIKAPYVEKNSNQLGKASEAKIPKRNASLTCIPQRKKYAVKSSWFPRVRHFDDETTDSDEFTFEEKPLCNKKKMSSFPQISTAERNKMASPLRKPTTAGGVVRENVQPQQQQQQQFEQQQQQQHNLQTIQRHFPHQPTHVSRRHTYAFDDQGAMFTHRHSMQSRGSEGSSPINFASSLSLREEFLRKNSWATIEDWYSGSLSNHSNNLFSCDMECFRKLIPKPTGCLVARSDYAFYLLPPTNRFRKLCNWFVSKQWFDYCVLLCIAFNCITLAMERPDIPNDSVERLFLTTSNYIFTIIFAFEMLVKVSAKGMLFHEHAYLKSGWNIMDGSLVFISLVDIMISFLASGSSRIFGILRVFRLLRALKPLRVISRAPGLKLVVSTLLSSLRPIGNIVLICCTFFIIFGILGVQLFKGTFYYCDGPDVRSIRNKTDCINKGSPYKWVNRKYNFDNLGQALMSLFVLASKDGWVNIMYTGLDAVGPDLQPQVNYNEWRLLYFISFLLLVGFFVLNMFVGVVVENFHKCRETQEKEEKSRRADLHMKKLMRKRRRLREPPYWCRYSKPRMFIHAFINSKYFDLVNAGVIGLNVIMMALEYYLMPYELQFALKCFNYFFTSVFIVEAIAKIISLGVFRYLRDRWNQLDVAIVILSVAGIALEEVKVSIIPINPTIIRVMRVLRIARVLKLLKMAKAVRALLDTVMQALPEVGNLGLLFFLLFFIFAALGVELFGRVECSAAHPCEGLNKHAHFKNFGMAFLTLFRVATGDNWNGIMKDALKDDCDSKYDCIQNCCVSTIIAPMFFVIFVLMAQFVLVNVVVAVLMKHLEESHKHVDDVDLDNEEEEEGAEELENVEGFNVAEPPQRPSQSEVFRPALKSIHEARYSSGDLHEASKTKFVVVDIEQQETKRELPNETPVAPQMGKETKPSAWTSPLPTLETHRQFSKVVRIHSLPVKLGAEATREFPLNSSQSPMKLTSSAGSVRKRCSDPVLKSSKISSAILTRKQPSNEFNSPNGASSPLLKTPSSEVGRRRSPHPCGATAGCPRRAWGRTRFSLTWPLRRTSWTIKSFRTMDYISESKLRLLHAFQKSDGCSDGRVESKRIHRKMRS